MVGKIGNISLVLVQPLLLGRNLEDDSHILNVETLLIIVGVSSNLFGGYLYNWHKGSNVYFAWLRTEARKAVPFLENTARWTVNPQMSGAKDDDGNINSQLNTSIDGLRPRSKSLKVPLGN